MFSEAEEMSKQYRQRLPAVSRTSESFPADVLPFDDESKLYANWEWFKFEQEQDQDLEPNCTDISTP